jgi:hypothetical protein
MPFYQTGSRPMAERGQIEFRPCDVLPNGEHVPKANVINDEEKGFMKVNGFQLLEQFAFEDAVLRSVHEEQFRLLNQAAVQLEHGRVRQVANLLSQPITSKSSGRRQVSDNDFHGTTSKVTILPAEGRNFLSASANSPRNVPISRTRSGCNSFTKAASNR